MCRQNCIDAGHVFCPSKYDGYYGTCCRQGDQYVCPLNDNVCSTDAPKESVGLKYYTCPHKLKSCGMSTRVTSPDGLENRVESKDIGSGAMCKYKLEFPSIAAEYDRLILKVNSVANAEIYAVQTLAFSSSSYAETALTASDDAIIIAYPYSLYLTVVADFSEEASQFEIIYWFDNRDPETLTEEEKAEGSIVPEKEIVIQEKSLYENY